MENEELESLRKAIDAIDNIDPEEAKSIENEELESARKTLGIVDDTDLNNIKNFGTYATLSGQAATCHLDSNTNRQLVINNNTVEASTSNVMTKLDKHKILLTYGLPDTNNEECERFTFVMNNNAIINRLDIYKDYMIEIYERLIDATNKNHSIITSVSKGALNTVSYIPQKYELNNLIKKNFFKTIKDKEGITPESIANESGFNINEEIDIDDLHLYCVPFMEPFIGFNIHSAMIKFENAFSYIHEEDFNSAFYEFDRNIRNNNYNKDNLGCETDGFIYYKPEKKLSKYLDTNTFNDEYAMANRGKVSTNFIETLIN